MSSHEEDKTIYRVVINDEEQYSIWPTDRENALGWMDVGQTGPKTECLAHIKEVWVDMRPLSLRKQMEDSAQEATQNALGKGGVIANVPPEKDDLIARLSETNQPVELSLRPEKSAQAFLERIQKGYVHIRFTGTRGETELGVRLDADALNMGQADFENQKGAVHLEGRLTLNYQKVRCIADIDLETLAGSGHLQTVEA